MIKYILPITLLAGCTTLEVKTPEPIDLIDPVGAVSCLALPEVHQIQLGMLNPDDFDVQTKAMFKKTYVSIAEYHAVIKSECEEKEEQG